MSKFRAVLILSIVFGLTTSSAPAEDKPGAKAAATGAGKSAGAGTNTAVNTGAAAVGSEVITGYLVDRSCAAAIKHDHADPTKRLQDHTKNCSLEPSCSDAGYTVYAGGRWIDLDPASNALAAKMIKASKKEKNLMCKMTGVLKRNEFHANTLAEVSQ